MSTGNTDAQRSNSADIDIIQKNDEIKKIYTKLFKDYVLSEREIKKIDDLGPEVKHPHHFYFLDFVPDNELNELFGVNLLTFSNNEKELETYKKDVDSGKELVANLNLSKDNEDLGPSAQDFTIE